MQSKYSKNLVNLFFKYVAPGCSILRIIVYITCQILNRLYCLNARNSVFSYMTSLQETEPMNSIIILDSLIWNFSVVLMILFAKFYYFPKFLNYQMPVWLCSLGILGCIGILGANATTGSSQLQSNLHNIFTFVSSMSNVYIFLVSRKVRSHLEKQKDKIEEKRLKILNNFNDYRIWLTDLWRGSLI